ncbi:hypothetical protein GGI35DRAFT_302605 [Trichoderma velutinum]
MSRMITPEPLRRHPTTSYSQEWTCSQLHQYQRCTSMSRDRGRKQARPGDIFPGVACLPRTSSACQLLRMLGDGQIVTLHAVEMAIVPFDFSAACVSTVFPQRDSGKSASSSIRLFGASLAREVLPDSPG